MIRWKYLGPRLLLFGLVCAAYWFGLDPLVRRPRLLLFGLVCAAYWFGLDPLVRRSLISLGQAATGTKVELGEVRTSLLDSRVRLADLKVADPKSPMHNLFELREASVDLETRSLMNRKFVVREAAVRGLKFHTRRETPGNLDAAPGAFGFDLELDGDRVADFALDWLEHVGATLQEEIEEDFESVKLVRELIQRWPTEYEQLKSRAESLYGQVDDLRGMLQSPSPGTNPLRSIETVQRVAGQVADVQGQIGQLRSDLERLHQQLLDDRDRVQEATEHDVERIRRIAHLEALDATTLSHYLLGSETGRWTRSLLTSIRQGRKYLPKKVDTRQPVRGRGTTYVFAEPVPSPDIIVRSLVLEGEGSVDGRPYQFFGKIEGLSSQPRLLGEPIRFAARTCGSIELALQVYLDNSSDPGHDRIAIQCPRLQQPELVLGREDQLALCVAPGTASVSVVLDIVGDELSGRLQFQRDDLSMTPTLGPKLGGAELASKLEDAMRDVRKLEAAVLLSGTFEKPQWTLRTGLGEQLAAGVNRVVRQEIEAYRDQLLARLDEEVSTELASLERLVHDHQRQVLDQLQLGDRQIEEIKLQVASRIQLPKSLMGKGSPLKRLFR
jgi:uncharacterized protein (TIGR03545 family)